MRSEINKKTNDLSIADIAIEYLQHWKWFLLSIIVAISMGILFLMMTPKEYKSSLSVLLNVDKGSNKISSEFINLESIGLLSTTDNIENEIIVLGSPDLMNLVVKVQNLNISYYQKTHLKETEIYKKTPFIASILTPSIDLFSGSCDLYIEKTGDSYKIDGIFIHEEIEHKISLSEKEFPQKITLNETSSLQINLSGKEIIENNKYLIKVRDIGSTTRILSSRLSVNASSQKSSVINLSLPVNNTEKGADILRELISQYNKLNLKNNNEIAYNTTIFINERLKEISVELSDAERDVVKYKQQYGIADLNSEAQLIVSKSGENEEKLMEIETQLKVLELIQNFINDPTNYTKIIPNMGVSDIGLSQIISEYNQKLLTSDQLLKGTGDKNPVRQRILEELKNIRSGISNSLVNVREAYTVNRNDLRQRLNVSQSRVYSVPKQEKGLIEKVREQKIKESLFLFLMQKREETNLSIAASSEKAKIVVSPQTNLSPISPKTRIIILASFILGLLTPIIGIYLRNLFKTNITNREEFEYLSDVSIIGGVTKNLTKDLLVVEKSSSSIAEMFRSLRNNIIFLSKNKKSTSILITSTASGEGKTFISINLAYSFASTGKKVLIIGGDIRKPKMREYLNSNSSSTEKGLSNYLIDENSDWKDYIHTPITDMNNFQALFAGTIPPFPNELLMTPRLKDLLEDAQKRYDYIIIDSAPVGLVSDSYFFNDFVDLTLYVVREKTTPKSAVPFINSLQTENKLKNMYVVLNETELTKNYKYGYGKEYGVGTE